MTFKTKFNVLDKLYAVVHFLDERDLSTSYIIFHGTIRSVSAIESFSEGNILTSVFYTFDNIDTPTGCDEKGHLTYKDPVVIERCCFLTEQEAKDYVNLMHYTLRLSEPAV
ncbi:MAG: hypothetical protein MJZ30_06005 [Paludibacteraceae bacterium]|nr:hypothetical protein [Paludibacteraceae bacterium]